MRIFFILLLLLQIGLCGKVHAHTPLCSCYDNGDGTITCEGGFSDGSSAAGVDMKVVDLNGKVIFKGKINEDGEFTFKKPKTPFKVIFNAGPGHVVEISSNEITE